MLQQQGSQQQLAHNSQQQTLQPHQQPQQLQQRKQKFVWGYIDGNNADDWTWDDDYNEDAIVSGTDQPWCFVCVTRGGGLAPALVLMRAQAVEVAAA